MHIYVIMLQTTLAMIIIALLLYSTYLYVRKHRKVIPAPEKFKPYACGEDASVETISVSSRNLYWAVISSVFKKLYRSLREKLHTGILNDWFISMVLYLTILFIVLVIIALLGVI